MREDFMRAFEEESDIWAVLQESAEQKAGWGTDASQVAFKALRDNKF